MSILTLGTPRVRVNLTEISFGLSFCHPDSEEAAGEGRFVRVFKRNGDV